MSFFDARHISKSYNGVQALDRFSLSIDEGEVVALLGPDGAGKTSFMRIVCDLIDADRSEDMSISFDDVDILREFDRVKPMIGYMPQTFSLYPDLSVEENMTFYAGIYGFTGRAYREKRDRMYAFSNLGPFARRRAGALSGGMKQKLALSCALLHDPRLLILDEPTTGVDPLSRRQFWEMLLQLRESGVTILVATPYMDEVERTDRAVCIFGGRKLTEASPEELARQFEGNIYYLGMDPTPELIGKLSDIEGIVARRFGSGLHLYTDEATDVHAFDNDLRVAGVEPEQIEPLQPSVEDRFIQLMERERE
ncbi:ATP-binding cassette domain-containing protein [candidate division GN15 bacterium]|nr:ATP-binding cassette domain-containing protein [candidate division GN15 bacterium]